MKGFVGGILTLIALQVFSSGAGPKAAGNLVSWIDKGLRAAISGDVAAIPTRKTAPPQSTGKSSTAPKKGYIDLPRNPSVGAIDV